MMRQVEIPHATRRRGEGAAPVFPDPYLRAWQARRRLDEWRAADRVLRRARGDEKAVHERAVARAMDHLQRFDSLDGLVDHFERQRYRRLSDIGEPPGDTLEAWVADACQVQEGALPLDANLVAGSALWRRASQIMGGVPA